MLDPGTPQPTSAALSTALIPDTRGIHVQMDGPVATIELRRPPFNYFDTPMMASIAEALEQLEHMRECRAVVLAAQGKSFCAGAQFGNDTSIKPEISPRLMPSLYQHALRIFAFSKPIVAAVQGAAIGGGLGLALTADFRIACEGARFAANFSRIGLHPGFGLSVTLPRLVGAQNASLMFYTGRRFNGSQALGMGLVDQLVPQEQVRAAAMSLALEIAGGSPAVVQSIRSSLRIGLQDALRNAMAQESEQQHADLQSPDFLEGVAAVQQRRVAKFADR